MIEIKYYDKTVTDGNILILPVRAVDVDITISCPCKGILTIYYNGKVIKTIDNFNGTYHTKGKVSPIGNINGGILSASVGNKSASVGIVFANECTLVAYLEGAIISTAPFGTTFGVSTPTNYVFLFAVPPYNYFDTSYYYMINDFKLKGKTDGGIDFLRVGSGTYRATIFLPNITCNTGVIRVATSGGIKA